MVKAKEVGEVMDKLQEAGAKAILALTIKNCRF